jgi:hypothetical protein
LKRLDVVGLLLRPMANPIGVPPSELLLAVR